MGKVGKFIVGGVLIGASFLIPGAAGALLALKSAMLSLGVSFASSAVFAPSGMSQRQGNVLANFPHTLAPLPVVYGKTMLGIRYVDLRCSGADNKYLWVVGALCHGSQDGNGIAGIDEIYFDGVLAVNAAGTVQSPYLGKVTLAKFLGTFTQNIGAASIAGTSLNAEFPSAWPATSQGRGVACIVMRLEIDEDVFPSGLPSVTCIVRGQRCLDPRTSTTAYTTNPALALYDYMTSPLYGLGAGSTEMDGGSTGSFATMANYYDQLVSVTGVGTQKRFEINGAVDIGVPCADNVRQILTTCRGNLIYEGGIFRLFTRQAQTAEVFELTPDNIVGDWSFHIPGIKERPNYTKGSYVNPDQNKYQADEVTYPRPDAANSYLTNDNNYLVEHQAEFPLTTNKYTVEQILNVTLKEMRSGITCSVTATEEALKLHTGDVVKVTHPTPGWVQKLFWVMGIVLDPSTGNVRLVLNEYDPNAYTLDAQTTLPGIPATNLPNPFATPPTVGFVTLSAGDADVVRDLDGSEKVMITASWVPVTDPYLKEYQVEMKLTSDSTWLQQTSVSRANSTIKLGPVSEGVSYDVRVRMVNTIGKVGPWSTSSVTPSLANTRQGSAYFEDFGYQFPGARWRLFFGTGEGVDTIDPDSLVGGHVCRVTGEAYYAGKESIAFDPSVMYIIRWRVRNRKTDVGGNKSFSLGLYAYEMSNTLAVGTDGFRNADELNVLPHTVCVASGTLAQSRNWTDYYGFVKGIAGGKATVSSVTGAGVTGTLSNLVDGSVTTIGANTDAATSGATIVFDMGAAKLIQAFRIYHEGGQASSALWTLQYADALAGPYTNAYSGFTPDHTGWQEVGWQQLVAHRYWRMLLGNTPGAGPDITEVEWVERTSTPGDAGTMASPTKMHPSTKFIRPMFRAGEGGGTDGEFDIDMLMIAVPAGLSPDKYSSEARRRTDTLYGADGVLLPDVLQDDGANGLPFVKGVQRGQSVNGGTVTFSPSFQGIPRVKFDGGISYQPNAGSWSPSFSTTDPQYDNFAPLDLTVSGFTTRARLRQPGAVIGLSGYAFAGTHMNVPGQTDPITITAAPSRDDQYEVAINFSAQLRSRYDGELYAVTIGVAIESSTDSGANWVTRALTSARFQTTQSAYQILTGSRKVKIVVTGMDSTDKIRLRLTDVTPVGPGYYLLTNTWAAGRTGSLYAVDTWGVRHETATENFASKTPGSGDFVNYEAEGYL